MVLDGNAGVRSLVKLNLPVEKSGTSREWVCPSSLYSLSHYMGAAQCKLRAQPQSPQQSALSPIRDVREDCPWPPRPKARTTEI